MARVALDLETDILPISALRNDAPTLIAQVSDSGRPLILTQHGRSAAVLIDVRVYQQMIDELDELRGVQRDLENAETERVTQEQVAARLAGHPPD